MNPDENAIPAELRSHPNRAVLAYVEDLSAHSDVAEALVNALTPLGDVQRFCPAPDLYRYLVASTKGIIFAVALGMDTIGLRLDDRMKSRALETGATPFPECGPEWVMFRLFRADWPKADLEFWVRNAYLAAREGR